MKTKNFGKRFTLNKKTIADLENISMANIKGGQQWISEIEPTTCGGGDPVTTDYTWCQTCMIDETILNC